MLPKIDEVREAIVSAAKQELLPRFAKAAVSLKTDGSMVTEADVAMQRRVRDVLAARWPEYALLGEELPEAEQARLLGSAGPGLWCLDPIDGTTNFAVGIPYYSTSLALLVGGESVLGIVYDPEHNLCYTAVKGKGAHLNGVPLDGRRARPPLAGGVGLIDFKRLPPALAARLATDPPYVSQRSFGSSALDWCTLAAGQCHCYLHGKQMIWDYAAGHLILAEANGCSATLDGDPVFRNELKPRSVVAAPNRSLFEEWLAWLDIGPAGASG